MVPSCHKKQTKPSSSAAYLPGGVSGEAVEQSTPAQQEVVPWRQRRSRSRRTHVRRRGDWQDQRVVFVVEMRMPQSSRVVVAQAVAKQMRQRRCEEALCMCFQMSTMRYVRMIQRRLRFHSQSSRRLHLLLVEHDHQPSILTQSLRGLVQ